MRRKLIFLAGAAFALLSGGVAAQTTPQSPDATQPQPDEPPAQEPAQQPTQAPPDEPAAQQPAADTQQPADEAQPPAATSEAGKAKAATAADLKAGASVYDEQGELVGKVDAVNADGAVVDTGNVKATLLPSSFAVGEKGLVIGMTKAELEAAAKAKTPK